MKNIQIWRVVLNVPESKTMDEELRYLLDKLSTDIRKIDYNQLVPDKVSGQLVVTIKFVPFDR